ncbi:MAG: GAF domain-containing protein [Firmicutes bacterium]|jgi:GAF domain-containing protein|uniref:GAF domain-containing protein n=1 Tax=Sulfobacillus benefaciens TaxID=453960 RepID=A0A2T2XBH9_9FIRM|nr:GAF domain-containing protein [Bacillota bacterium]MCL5012424.1 GAF domain-containing protein [Bacillota bacterium]PSR31807.1 MAG: hypothetical protein C7B43_00880 [Sulfobacillus benefaciens]
MSETSKLKSALESIANWTKEGPDDVAIMANVVAQIRLLWPEWSWIGFYRVFHLGQDLMVGPFSGPPSPLVIPWGQGVIGSCAAERAVQIVGSIKKFPGYIAAVPETRSEVGLPVIRNNHLYAVLDCQSPEMDGVDLLAVEWLAEVAQNLS